MVAASFAVSQNQITCIRREASPTQRLSLARVGRASRPSSLQAGVRLFSVDTSGRKALMITPPHNVIEYCGCADAGQCGTSKSIAVHAKLIWPFRSRSLEIQKLHIVCVETSSIKPALEVRIALGTRSLRQDLI